MKRTRKGFTLVELLIVVAILATLTATMMISMNGATAKAKASSIAANLDACHTAAMLYYSKYGDRAEIKDKTTTQMLEDSLKTWDKMKGDSTKDTIYYTACTINSKSAPDKWAVLVDFSADPEAEEIAKALKRMRAYSGITAFVDSGVFDFLGATPAFADDTTNKLYMTLITGEITAGEDGLTKEGDTASSNTDPSNTDPSNTDPSNTDGQ